MKIEDRDVGFLRLLLRSPNVGDGWRQVSSMVWPLIEKFGRPELIEVEPSPVGGGKVRLSERGSVVVDYV